MTSNAELIERYSMGDKDAYAQIVEQNMGLVYSVVKRFLNRSCEYEDLVQIGAMGLIKAVKRFDNSLNVQFSTYAVPMIIGEIKRFLRDDGAIRVSRSLKERAIKGRATEERLRKALGRNPTIGEIAQDMQIEETELIEAFDASIKPDSLQSAIGGDDGVQLMEMLSSDDTEEKIVDKVFLKEILTRLNERELRILIMRYYKGKTQSEIAELIGVSQVQVSRLEKKALEKLRSEANL